MAQYVQKIRVPVRLARIGAEPVTGVISIAPRAELHDCLLYTSPSPRD